jgi:maleylacetate reductase
MQAFVYESRPVRVVFGAGCLAQLPDEVMRLGAGRALVLATPGQRALAERAAAILGPLAVGVHAAAVMHVPLETAAAARAEAARLHADAYVAIGGGSTIGLAKAIALETGQPIVAVPTTYAGSEMTPIWGLTEGGLKRTGRDERVRPLAVLFDPSLTLTLPPKIAGPSGMNALAHCVEALYAPDGNPVISLMAEEGIRALAASLPAVVRAPGDLQARGAALYGAWLAGAALGAATLGLHHKICHTLGGSFSLPHAEAHTVILPHAAAYNAAAAPDAMARTARALGVASAPAGLFDLAAALGAPTSLRAIGMAEADLDRAAELVTQSPYANPAPVTREGVRRLLDDAFHGRRPEPTV